MSDPIWKAQLYIPVSRRKTIHLLGTLDETVVMHFRRFDDLIKSAQDRGARRIEIESERWKGSIIIEQED